jgi:hypothetical protein
MPKKSPSPIFAYKQPPAIPHRVIVKGQRHWLLRVTPWECKDGRMSHVLAWVTECAECGTPFTQTSGMIAYSLNSRCPIHRHRKPRTVRGKVERAMFIIKNTLCDPLPLQPQEPKTNPQRK